MKIPSEGELIEIERRVLDYWAGSADSDPSFGYRDRIVATLRSLIALARNVNRRLFAEVQEISRRTSVPEPAPSARPKRKKAKV